MGCLKGVCYRFGRNCSGPEAATVKARSFARRACVHGARAVRRLRKRSETEEMDDAAGRIQYSWFTGDARELQTGSPICKDSRRSKAPGLKAYYPAYGRWRLAQL